MSLFHQQSEAPRLETGLPASGTGVNESVPQRLQEQRRAAGSHPLNPFGNTNRTEQPASAPGQDVDEETRNRQIIQRQLDSDREMAARMQRRYSFPRRVRPQVPSTEELETRALQPCMSRISAVEIDPTPSSRDGEGSEQSGSESGRRRGRRAPKEKKRRRVVKKLKHWGKVLVFGYDENEISVAMRERQRMDDLRDGGPGPPTGVGSARSMMKERESCLVI